MEQMFSNNPIETQTSKPLTLQEVNDLIGIRKEYLKFLEKKLQSAMVEDNATQIDSIQKMKATANERLGILEKQKVELENKKDDGKDLKLAA